MDMAANSVTFANEENSDKKNPVLPLFTQMNVRRQENDEIIWKETSRWVKFQEDVEDGGKRWSKPYVPSLQLSALLDLKQSLENGIVALDLEGKSINEIIDELYCQHDDDESRPEKVLDIGHFEDLKMLLSQRIKLRMKLNLIGKMSSVTSSSPVPSRPSSMVGMSFKSAPSSRTGSQESLGPPSKGEGSQKANKQHPTVTSLRNNEGTSSNNLEDSASGSPGFPRANSVSTFSREKDAKLRAHNLFIKKVPRGAESCLIFVAGDLSFLSKPITIFIRLNRSAILDNFCEISAPTRFIGLVLGPSSEHDRLKFIGKALGTAMSDQIFPLVAYRAKEPAQVFAGLDAFAKDVTVLAPSVWDYRTRLDPPKALPSLDSRLSQMRQHSPSPLRHLSGNTDPTPGSAYGTYNQSDGAKLAAELLLFQGQTKKVDVEKGGGASGGGDDDPDGGGGDDRDSEDREDEDMGEGAGNDDALKRTGKLFGGLVLDVKRKWPWYLSDFTDALHIQTLAAIIYIYLATITKAITFGGFLGDITEGVQGVLESFLGHAIAGGFFCLLGGQPLTVLGCTGPVLIFEKILVDFCKSYAIDYLTFRLWIGLWSSLFCLVIVATDASAIVRYFTRFTEESFAALIGIIFIVEALKKLYYMTKTFKVHTHFILNTVTLVDCDCLPPEDPISFEAIQNITLKETSEMNALNKDLDGIFDRDVSDFKEIIPWNELTLSQCKMLNGNLVGETCPYAPDIFFFSVILFFGTFALAYFLKKFKFTPYFPAKIRSLISDYAVIIAILVFVGVDNIFHLETPKLIVPTEFKPTRSDVRGWIIPFTQPDIPIYIYFVSIVPAILLTILLFMDQQITSVIVNRSEHKLRKGCGYHLDMLIVGLMIGACSIFGLPWCVAATVLCLGHVDSLKMETETSAPGEIPQFLGVREQRVTGVMVFVLTGLSVKLAPILKYIPMPVLYGVLMYMGIASLRGMQFIDRIGLLFMPPKHQPDHTYLRHVPLRKVHLFTLIQILGLVLLWIIKSTPASLIFPLMVLALVGFRKLMDYCPCLFTQEDLFWLDNLMPDKVKGKGKKGSKKSLNEAESKTRDTEAESSNVLRVSVVNTKKAPSNGNLSHDLEQTRLLQSKESEL